MSSVIIGKPNIKYLQTYADKRTHTDTTADIYISAFKTNVQEIYTKMDHYITIGSFISASGKADYNLYDAENNNLASWTVDNTSNTTTKKAIKVINLGKLDIDKYPLKLNVVATGTVETAYSVHPTGLTSTTINKLLDAEKIYFGTNNMDVGDSGGTLWNQGGLSIILFASDPDSGTDNNLWGVVYSSSIGLDRPVKFTFYYQKGATFQETNSTSLIIRIIRGVIFWV